MSAPTEIQLVEVKASVYTHENGDWVAKDAGQSRLWIFFNQSSNLYRIIGRSLENNTFNLNYTIKPDLLSNPGGEFQKNVSAESIFVQFKYRDTYVGLSFFDEPSLDKFYTELEKVVQILNNPQRAPSPNPASVAAAPAQNNANPANRQCLATVTGGATTTGTGGFNGSLSMGSAALGRGRGGASGQQLTRTISGNMQNENVTPPGSARGPVVSSDPTDIRQRSTSVAVPTGVGRGAGMPGMGRGTDTGRMLAGSTSMDQSTGPAIRTQNGITAVRPISVQMQKAPGADLVGRSNSAYAPALPNRFEGGGSAPGTPSEEVRSTPRTNSMSSSNGGILGIDITTTDMNSLGPRDKRVKEIYTTEVTYVQQLGYMCEYYRFAESDKEAKNLFAAGDLTTLFSNIKYIRDFNKSLLDEFESRLKNWDPPGVQTCIGDVFLNKWKTGDDAFLRKYSEYCANLKQANALYEKMLKNKKIANWFNLRAAANHGQVLGALLITPLQRVTRYVMLLKEIVSHTDASHPDYKNLEEAREYILQINTQINQRVLSSDSSTAVQDLSKQIPGIAQLLNKQRQLIKHGPVTIRANTQYNYMLLFSDICVFAAPMVGKKNKLQMSDDKIQLESCWVDDLNEIQANANGTTTGAETIWQLYTPENQYQLMSESKEDKINWVNKFRENINTCCLNAGCNKPGGIRQFKHIWPSKIACYDGEWLEAKPHGYGKRMWDNKNEYEGNFVKDRCEGFGKMKYNTGEVYEGEWVKDKPHGQGTLKTREYEYVGQWNSGKKTGNGTITYTLGYVFEGSFAEDKFNGFGKLTCNDGTFYEGEYKDDKFCGQGKLQSHEGYYEGGFEDGMRSGYGKMTWFSGNWTYEGGWKADNRHGKGTYQKGDASYIYEGDWVEDKQEGNGKITLANGAGGIYEGGVKDGKKFGEGVHQTYVGTYTGSFADDKKTGKGKFLYPDGSSYEGEWQNDVHFGTGTQTEADGSKYHGKWMKGQRQGMGLFLYKDGSKYTGNWVSNKKSGEGVFETANGRVKYTGAWLNDRREGEGTMVMKYETGGEYEYRGGWKGDMREGKGVEKHGDGRVYEGMWKNDRKDGEGKLQKGPGSEELRMEFKDGLLVQPFMNEAPPDIVMPRFLARC
eukprot:TRINITY_DN8381_c0_g1_i1.p1 TRINITY_DN8381_c0_g1~~TRINITY_DN8381_c0_g1_i1.p1  ORF type:complete len:1131 (-),score=296.07 TRINITY_DN8381_c0_g1_i1:134-3526(-)